MESGVGSNSCSCLSPSTGILTALSTMCPRAYKPKIPFMYDPKPETHWYGRYNGSGIAASLPVLLGGLGLFSDTVSSGSSTPDLLSACIGSAILIEDECVERNILNRMLRQTTM